MVWSAIVCNPGWLASVAVHIGAAAGLSVVLFTASPRQQGLGIEGGLGERLGEVEFESGFDGDSVELSGSPPPAGQIDASSVLQQSADQAAAQALGQIRGLGFGQGGSGDGTGTGTGSGRAPGPGAGFFGSQGQGKTFVYVVDMSASMSGERFRRAISELIQSINRLKPEQSFYVYFFNDRAYPLFDPHPARGMVPATPPNRSRASRWIRTRQPASTTNPHLAIQQALEMKPDVIFLLTDGELDEPEEVQKMIRKYNKSGVSIHTIAFENPDGAATLKTIAEENKGTFRFVK